MKKIEIIKWQTCVVTDSSKLPYTVEYSITLPKQEFDVAKALFKNYIEIRRTSYSKRENNHPMMYYDHKHHFFYKPSDVHTNKLNLKKLDFIYAEMKYDGHLLYQPVLTPILTKKEKLHVSNLSSNARNQTIHYPTIFKLYLESLYHQNKLELPYDPIHNRIIMIDQLLYHTTFITHYLTPENMSAFILWINDTYNLAIRPEKLKFHIHKCD